MGINSFKKNSIHIVKFPTTMPSKFFDKEKDVHPFKKKKTCMFLKETLENQEEASPSFFKKSNKMAQQKFT